MSIPPCPVSAIAHVGQAHLLQQPQGFEGPEKRLEVVVRGKESLAKGGLRVAPQKEWEDIIAILKAQIVSRVENDDLDAYVLTESSLFVYPHKMILITCGTTILLHALPAILDLVSRLGLEVEWSSFMRKNFTYPWEQIGPHATMEAEYTLLKSHFPGGSPYIFGPVDGDHYFCYIFDDIAEPGKETDVQISMTMYDMDPEVAKTFYSDKFMDGELTAPIRKASGVDTLVPAPWLVQDLQFAPCGYSINAILGDCYQTMHITPEEHCSFASYETNQQVDTIAPQLNKVLAVFKPQRFSVLVLADPNSTLGSKHASRQHLGFGEIEGYQTSNVTENNFAPGQTLLKANFVRA